ncbi:MAG: hypothetical protein HYV26_09775 [Candidatus Hydrogenedentes bacterium]|nr:hypothetical protein [Candidatus Hydrogenedentota bacterium]
MKTCFFGLLLSATATAAEKPLHEILHIALAMDSPTNVVIGRIARQHWEQAASYFRAFRKQGLTLPELDVLIAVVASEQDLTVLCRDEHFDQIMNSGICPLKVTQVL